MEIVFLRGFGLTGKYWGLPSEDSIVVIKSTYQGKPVDVIFKDTHETKYYNNKPRRIFELDKINGQATTKVQGKA